VNEGGSFELIREVKHGRMESKHTDFMVDMNYSLWAASRGKMYYIHTKLIGEKGPEKGEV